MRLPSKKVAALPRCAREQLDSHRARTGRHSADRGGGADRVRRRRDAGLPQAAEADHGRAPARRAPPKPARPPIPQRKPVAALAAGETYVYEGGVARRDTIAAARAAGLLDVDLGDGWAPFILQDGEGEDAKPNAYRETFVGLANDRLDADGDEARPGEHNFLEVFGIPPSLSVLAARVEADASPAREACVDAVDRQGLEQWTGDVIYLDRDRARREYEQALQDAAWVDKTIAASARRGGPDGGAAAAVPREKALEALRADPKLRGARRPHAARAGAPAGRARDAGAHVVRGPADRAQPPHAGMYDLQSHEALATWERKHDIFGWGFVGGETLGMLLRPTRPLSLEAFKRVLAERVADAAGIVEDGSINLIKRKNPITWRDSADAARPVPNLIDDHVNALLAAIGVATPEDMIAFLRAHKDALARPARRVQGAAAARVLPARRGRVAHEGVGADRSRRHLVRPAVRREGQADRAAPRPLPAPDPVVRLARPEDPARPVADDDRVVAQRDARRRQRLHEVQELGHRPARLEDDRRDAGLDSARRHAREGSADDQGAGSQGRSGDDRQHGRDGPGYQSAYGLVMGIHVDPKRGGFDNQIRTHGSVDYTSIARRFSHGCHRLVNNRAVRLFDFVLRHRPFKRVGNVPLNLKKRFEVDGEDYKYAIKTRGYYYELPEPIQVTVLEGKIMGDVKKPITAYVRKPGVDYGEDLGVGDAAASTAITAPGRGPEPAP